MVCSVISRRLKQELLAANSKIALQEQELAQTRVIKHTLDQALGPWLMVCSVISRLPKSASDDGPRA
jgi:hypothetical protein